jgi:hypothetical protein
MAAIKRNGYFCRAVDSKHRNEITVQKKSIGMYIIDVIIRNKLQAAIFFTLFLSLFILGL